ncbi:RICIN domain-containing protein [Actinoplanes sp. ATCC 53533]|uniref:RICIN domain-containing protein n=1 Tax=Actinoplanes sp. ATCC 53533 TaxID=1288362 RepID=UPI001315731D|nr:RICIN domain-containing protein [Actinoplanes sp. ATCC 53533]
MRRILAGVLTAAALTLTAVVLPQSAALAVDSGTLDVLTYNIAGLPEILSSAATDRESSTTAIGQRLGPYDIVNVQEDFNYHALLYAADSHPYRTPTSGGVPFGSGLNTLSSHYYDGDDFERVTWDSCDSGSGDCLTPKGFTFMRVRLAEGVWVDVYNVHTDAGSEPGDLAARAANLSQLTAFIQTRSAGNAVVVMGDTNTRYTRTGDTIAEFAATNGLTDAWVQLVRGGSAPAKGSDALVCDSAAVTNDCEVVDKILYRGSRFVNLDATSYNNEHAKFLEDGTGLMLSDHYPLTAKLSWSTNPAYRFSDQFGGPHGDYFNDVASVPWGAQTTSISLRSGERVDQVGVTLSNGTALTHGGTGGSAQSLTLGRTEYVTQAYLCRAKHNDHTRIFSARFTTSLGRSLSGGSTTSDCTTITAPAGWQIAGFHGRSGDDVDKLGFIFTPNDFELVNRATGKCLDVINWSTADGADVRLWTCTGGNNQRWRIEPLADGTSRIVNTHSDKTLDVLECGTADGASIQQYTWWNNACERWQAVDTDSGWFRLVNPNSGKVADVADCDSADGTDVRLWTWLNNYCQQWSLRP